MSRLRFLAFALLVAGCTRIGGPATKKDNGRGAAKADPWTTFTAELARQPDAPTARRALHQLNAELESGGQPLPALSAEETAKFTALLHPSPDELKDWQAKGFTSMDGNYLAECLFFRAVARGLDVDGLPPGQQAKAAFDWVCRQMVLAQWQLPVSNGRAPMPPVPPQIALRRGFGTGVEREAAFLALARQLGLDPVLIGPPGGETLRRFEPRLVGPPGSELKRPPDAKPEPPLTRGPFWAVGVHDGGDIAVFDPWTGESVGSLSAVKANPSRAANSINAKKSLIGANVAEISRSVAYSAFPLTALEPRMKELEAKLAPEFGVKLFVIPVAPVYASPLETDPFSILHVLGVFTPKADGGYDPTPPGPQQLAGLAARDEALAVLGALPPPRLLGPEARDQFLGLCLQRYSGYFLDSNLRERLQRGQFQDVSKALVELDRDFARSRESFRTDTETARLLEAWDRNAGQAYEALRLSVLPENAGKRPAAESAVNSLWGPNAPIQREVAAIVAEVGSTEAIYLLALCKHEQAVRTQLRFVRGKVTLQKAAEDWSVAKDWWTRYLLASKNGDAAHPGRVEQAARLEAEAAALAANPEAR